MRWSSRSIRRSRWTGRLLGGLSLVGALALSAAAAPNAGPAAAATGPASTARSSSHTSATTAGVPTPGPNEPVAGPRGTRPDNLTFDYSLNWSGIADTGTTFTGVTGDWAVPTVLLSSAPEYSATWIGIDGFNDETLIQTGTEQDSASGTTSYSAWYELLPADPVTINEPVSPGDQMAASISQESATTWLISLQDVTAKWTFAQTVSYTTPGESAEWIEEAPSSDEGVTQLADFGTTTFTNVSATGTDMADAVQNPIQMVDFDLYTIAYPSAFDTTTDSFTITYGTPPYGQPTITTSLLAPAGVGVPYSQQVVASGGLAPYSWSLVEGNLPAGLSLDPSTGVISGTPTTAGMTTFYVGVSDASGGEGYQELSITVLTALPDLSLTSSTSSEGYEQVGDVIPISYLVSNGDTVTLSDVGVDSQLVASVSCPSSTLTPGADEICTGSYTVTSADVTSGSVTDSATASGRTPGGSTLHSNVATLTVTEVGCAVPFITSPSTATAVVGTAFSFTVSACSELIPTFSATGLPKGLKLTNNDDGTATIAGTPKRKAAGLYAVALSAAVPGSGNATQTLDLSVDIAPSIKTKPKATALVGTPFNLPIQIGSGFPAPTVTTASTLPGGIGINQNGGTYSLSGTPTADSGGTYTIVLTAANGVGDGATATVDLAVVQAPAITSTASDTVTARSPMTPFTVTATGYPAPRLSVSSGLPPGVQFTKLTGTFAGTPQTQGTYTVTITATNKAGTTSQTFTFTVNP